MLDRPLTAIARSLDVPWISPDRLTITGLVVGVASAVAAGLQWWAVALVLWLVSRVIDGLDGALARRRRSTTSDGPVAGSTASSTIPASIEQGFQAGNWPLVYAMGTLLSVVAIVVLLAYYVNGAAFLAFSSIAERTGRTLDDGRSLSFLGRIAEGTETIVVHSLWLILPAFAWQLAVLWAGFVAVSATQRIVVGYRTLR